MVIIVVLCYCICVSLTHVTTVVLSGVLQRFVYALYHNWYDGCRVTIVILDAVLHAIICTFYC